MPLVAQEGKTLRELVENSVFSAITASMNTLAQRFASEILGAERSERVGQRLYRSGTRSITAGTSFGPISITLVKTRAGVLRPDFLATSKRLTVGMA